MFRIDTNFDHWHTIYLSKDCSAELRSTAVGGGIRSSFPSSTLATSPEGIGERQFVVILIVDKLSDLWALEAVFRSRLGGEIDRIFSHDGEVRRRAVARLKEVAESLDVNLQTFGEVPEKRRKWSRIHIVGVVAASIFLVAGVGLIRGGGDDGDQVSEAERLLQEVEAGVSRAKKRADEARASLEEMKRIHREVEARLGKDIPEAQSSVSESKTILESIRDIREDVNESARQSQSIAAESKERLVEMRKIYNELLPLLPTKSKTFQDGHTASPSSPDGKNEASETETGMTSDDESPVAEREHEAGPQSPGGNGANSDTEGMKVAQAERVKEIQEFLIETGYPEVGEIDGRFGDHTKTAFLIWRSKEGHCAQLTKDSSIEEFLTCADESGRIPGATVRDRTDESGEMGNGLDRTLDGRRDGLGRSSRN